MRRFGSADKVLIFVQVLCLVHAPTWSDRFMKDKSTCTVSPPHCAILHYIYSKKFCQVHTTSPVGLGFMVDPALNLEMILKGRAEGLRQLKISDTYTSTLPVKQVHLKWFPLEWDFPPDFLSLFRQPASWWGPRMERAGVYKGFSLSL